MNDNRCIFCGEIIPEGLQVCYNCNKCILYGETFSEGLQSKFDVFSKTHDD